MPAAFLPALLVLATADPTGPWLAIAGLITAVGGTCGGVAALVAAVAAFKRHKTADPPEVDDPEHDQLWLGAIEQLEAANEMNADLRRQLSDANRREAAANSRAARAQQELIDFLRKQTDQ